MGTLEVRGGEAAELRKEDKAERGTIGTSSAISKTARWKKDLWDKVNGIECMRTLILEPSDRNISVVQVTVCRQATSYQGDVQHLEDCIGPSGTSKLLRVTDHIGALMWRKQILDYDTHGGDHAHFVILLSKARFSYAKRDVARGKMWEEDS